MTAVTVGDELEKERSLAVNYPLPGELDGLVRRDDVHAINL